MRLLSLIYLSVGFALVGCQTAPEMNEAQTTLPAEPIIQAPVPPVTELAPLKPEPESLEQQAKAVSDVADSAQDTSVVVAEALPETLDLEESTPLIEPLCLPSWFLQVENQVNTQDMMGHGPDLGSIEWRRVVTLRLGLRQEPSVPVLNTGAWCQYIDEYLKEMAKDS